MENASNANTILDTIKEQTTNIEACTNHQHALRTIREDLKEIASKERATREATITFKLEEGTNPNHIMETIEKEWVERRDLPAVTYWSDKEHTFAQFLNGPTKQVFVEHALRQKEKDGPLYKIIKMASKPNDSGYHFQRKEIKIEITGARQTILPAIIDQTLRKIKSKDGTVITPIREGKPYGPAGRKVRSLMFKVNEGGFDVIFNQLGGNIPYTKLDTSTKIRLFPRINVRPWSCRDCFHVGPNHECKGKICAQCGSKDHITKDCKSNIRFCTNCKKRGHRAKDLHCTLYLREVVKEIKRMDIPLEFLEEEEKRCQLARSLILK